VKSHVDGFFYLFYLFYLIELLKKNYILDMEIPDIWKYLRVLKENYGNLEI